MMDYKVNERVSIKRGDTGEWTGARVHHIAEVDNKQFGVYVVRDDSFSVLEDGTYVVTEPELIRHDGEYLPAQDIVDSQSERGLGLKYDAGKPQYRLVFEGLPLTLQAVGDVLDFGAKKYQAHSWQHVENGIDRYNDAAARHYLARLRGEENDPESGLPHEYHELVNRLFVLELKLREKKDAD